MLALTLKHPWPFAICQLGKRIENRTWFPSQTQLKVGDWFAIHGGKKPVGQEELFALNSLQGLRVHFKEMPTAQWFASWCKTGIVAVAKFGGHVIEFDQEGRDLDFWFEGPCGWLLSEVIVLPKAIPMRGAQGLWTVPSDVAAQLTDVISGVV